MKSVLKIALIALLLRLLVAGLAYWGVQANVVLWPNRGVELFGIARSLALGQGFSSPFSVNTGPTAFMAPVYPAILASIFKIFGIATISSAWVMIVLQSTFSAATCVPIYFLAARIFDSVIANRAAWAWAVFPYAIVLPCNFVWDSSLSALLVISGVLLLYEVVNANDYLRWSAAGAYWAFASLTNASFLLILPAFVIWFVAIHPATGHTNKKPLWLGILVFLLCLFPWTVRNGMVMNAWVPIRSNFALELWIGNHTRTDSWNNAQIHPAFNSNELDRFVDLGEIEYMAQKRAAAFHFIRHDPRAFLYRTASRFVRFWTGAYNGLFLKSLITPLAIFGWAGTWLVIGKFRLAPLLLIPVFIYPLPFYITHPDLRYQHPIQPVLMILATYAASSLLTFVRQHRVRREELVVS